MLLVLVILGGWVLLGVPVALLVGRAARAGSDQTALPGGPAAHDRLPATLLPAQSAREGIRRAAA